MFSFFLRFSTTVFAQLAGLVVLLLVVRLCVVFFHSRRRYWRSAGVAPRRGAVEARARLLSVPLPFMTILIPAREEALVIRNTILSMARLDYPRDRYAVVVVTDEKERRNGSRCATTQSVVEETKRELSMTFPDMTLVHEEVPHDFDGRIGGACVGTPVPSTKGRALNWALSRISEKTDFCVFVDAEGHLLPHALLAVAEKYLEDPAQQVFQCPIFQVRNFWNISPFSKVAALAQAFTHEAFLPTVLNKVPFLGGTNLFIHKEPLLRVGGFSQGSLTEDLDLGVRLHLFANQWPVYLPVPSSEQTPPSVRAYFKQRTRWGLGFLGVLRYLGELDERGIEREKVRVLLRRFMLIGPAEWFMYFILTLTSLFVYVSRALAGVFLVFDVRTHSFYLPFPQTLHEVAIQILSLSAFPLLFFSLFLLFRYKRFIAGWAFRARLVAPFVWFIFSILFVLPFTFFIYPLPFVHAVFVQFVLRRGKRVESLWVKTPRTVEAG